MDKIKSIPKWILIVSGLFAALGLMVSSSLCFSPQSVLPMVDLGAKGVQYLIYMWAARQFAIGFIFGFATWKKSQPMLTLAYIFFLVMNIADFFIGIHQQDNGLIFGALLMCVVSSAMIYFINKD
jgi:FtsH-binding integral membrane protein